jgi:DNA-binding HxlR family transcriptional regulator
MQMKRHIYDCQSGCPVESTLQIIAGKWKSVIIYHLMAGTERFNSRRMLALQLHELQVDGVIQKRVYPVVPVKTEYSLTDFGQTLRPVITAMETWGDRYNKRALSNMVTSQLEEG